MYDLFMQDTVPMIIQQPFHCCAAYAEYILMSPSEAYKPYMDTMREKIHMSKVVIEFLQNNQEATYEDLLNKIQVTHSSTQESLLIVLFI